MRKNFQNGLRRNRNLKNYGLQNGTNRHGRIWVKRMLLRRAFKIAPGTGARYLFFGILSISSMLCSVPVYSQTQPAPTSPAITVMPGTQTFLVWGDLSFTLTGQCDAP